MKREVKAVLSIIAAIILVVWFWNQCFPYQMSDEYKEHIVETVQNRSSASEAPEGFTRMNGFYNSNLTEPNTCATNEYPVGTRVTIWCGIDAEHGSSVEATVVSNTVHTNVVNTIELSENINKLFAGDTYIYPVWVKEVTNA